MRVGRLPENIYMRSVDRIVHKYNKDILKGAAPGKGCAFLCAKDACLSSRQELWQTEMNLVLAAMMAEAAAAGQPAGSADTRQIRLQAEFILPTETEEPELRVLMQAFTEIAGAYDLPISRVEVRTGIGIGNVGISFTMLGLEMPDRGLGESLRQTSEGRSDAGTGRDIVMIGRAAATGAAYLAAYFADTVAGRFSAEYVRRMLDTDKAYLMGMRPAEYYGKLCRMLEGRASYICTPVDGAVYAAGEGGIFASLWNLGKAHDCGLRVNIKDIPVYQESIEVCDILDVNLYMTYSGGCMLITAADGKSLAEDLQKAGYEAACIGFLTEDHDRVIINGDEERYLTAPAADEIYRKVLERLN